jgi:hypothetical protein
MDQAAIELLARRAGLEKALADSRKMSQPLPVSVGEGHDRIGGEARRATLGCGPQRLTLRGRRLRSVVCTR